MLRASEAWLYMACPQAADKVRKGEAYPEAHKSDFDNEYMAFGRCAHHAIQEGLGCVLEPLADEDRIMAEPMLPKLNQVTANAIDMVKQSYPGAEWIAETEHNNGNFQGHTDLWCEEQGIVIDIKTCTKLPSRKTIAIEHYWQLLAYSLLTGAETLHILYVHSGGEWTVLSDKVSLGNRDVRADRYSLSLVLSDKVLAFRSYGGHCSKCPWCSVCRVALLPKVGEVTKPVEFCGGSFEGLG